MLPMVLPMVSRVLLRQQVHVYTCRHTDVAVVHCTCGVQCINLALLFNVHIDMPA